MVLHCVSKLRRWKSPSTPNIPARSAERFVTLVREHPCTTSLIYVPLLKYAGLCQTSSCWYLALQGMQKDHGWGRLDCRVSVDFVLCQVWEPLADMLALCRTTTAATVRSTVRRLRELAEV
jgi:hypothetical protein